MAVERVVSFPGLGGGSERRHRDFAARRPQPRCASTATEAGWPSTAAMSICPSSRCVMGCLRRATSVVEVEAGDLIAGMPARDDQTIIAVGGSTPRSRLSPMRSWPAGRAR
jgi:hypothetical protein